MTTSTALAWLVSLGRMAAVPFAAPPDIDIGRGGAHGGGCLNH